MILKKKIGNKRKKNKSSMMKKNISHIFKHNNKWYKLALRIDETDVTPSKDISEKKSDY